MRALPEPTDAPFVPDYLDNSFMIVARAIEAMAVNPTKSQKTMLRQIANMIAHEQTADIYVSKYKGVWFDKKLQRWETSLQKNKKKYKVYGKTDDECYLRRMAKKAELENRATIKSHIVSDIYSFV